MGISAHTHFLFNNTAIKKAYVMCLSFLPIACSIASGKIVEEIFRENMRHPGFTIKYALKMYAN